MKLLSKIKFTFFLQLIVAISCCIYSLTVNAQMNYQFTTYTQEDGLASGTLKSIAKDPTGFLWLMSESGLTRFDGYSFKVFQHKANDSASIPSSVVTNMSTDEEGHILFRTINGLCRYNPSTGTFTSLLQNESNDYYKAMFLGSKGIYTVTATQLIHVNITNGHKVYFSLPAGLNTNAHLFACYYNNNVFVCDGKSIYKFDEQSKTFQTRLPILYKNKETIFELKSSPLSLFVSNDGLCINAKNQLFKYNSTKKLFTEEYNWSNFPVPYFDYVTGMRVVKKEWLVITSLNNNVFLFNVQNGKEKIIALNNTLKERSDKIRIISFDVSKDNTLWITTEASGIFHVNIETEEVQQISPTVQPWGKSNTENSELILADSNVVWISAPGIGLIKMEENKILFKTYQPVQNASSDFITWSKNVRTIAQLDNNTLLIGTLEGLFKFNLTTYQFSPLLSPVDNKPIFYNLRVSKLLIDKEKNLWVSSWKNNGVYVLNYEQHKMILIKPDGENVTPAAYISIRSMFIDSHGYLWLGTADDIIYRANMLNKKITQLNQLTFEKIKGDGKQLVYNICFSITENNKGNILLGTQSGLYEYDYTTHQISSYRNSPDNKNTISDNSIRCFFLDKNKTMWIGTNGDGLNKMDETNHTFKSYTTTNGLPDNTVYAINEDSKGFLWLATGKGICRFDKSNASCTNYTLKDGIQNYEFNTNSAAKLLNGNIAFGGINGFNIFNPNDFTISKAVPTIVITQFKVGEKEKPLANQITQLQYDENYISFQFASLNFFRNNENLYAYKLEGLDKDWVYCINRRFTNYANLSPGNYTFRVKAANCYGVWNEAGTSISFVIATPWWNTWLFRCIVIAVILLLIYFVFQFRLQQKLNLQHIRNRIASDLHDEIGSTLSSISLFSEVAQKVVHDKAPEADHLLTQITDSTTEMMEAMSDIVWTINSKNDRFDNIINRIRAYAIERMEPVNGIVKMEIDEAIHTLALDMVQRKNIYLILKEAVNNAAKYADCKKLLITLSFKNKIFTMKISDDGKGFEPNLSTDGNGLQNMQKRADDLKGKIIFQSEKGKGTTIELTFKHH